MFEEFKLDYILIRILGIYHFIENVESINFGSEGKQRLATNNTIRLLYSIYRKIIKMVNKFIKDEMTLSESSRLIRLEEELSLLKNKFNLQNLKNEEYDKTVDFVKEFKIKEKELQSSQKHEIETLKGILSKVQSKEETRDNEMKELKEKVKKIETNKISEDHHQHQIVKRQNSITTKPSMTTRLPCIPKNACAFDYSKDATVSTASSDKMTTSTSSLSSVSKSFNLPSSCKDLSTNGHTSNGIYLLYDSSAQKVSTAFCDFNKNKGISNYINLTST